MTVPLPAAVDAALIGRPWTAADTPALVVDLDRMAANIAAMAELAGTAGLALRPHFKTHKSVEIARRQVAAGAIGMTVAKLDEATILIDAGIDDILVAYEIVGPLKVARAVELASRARLTVGVDSLDGARALSAAGESSGLRLQVSIEVDSGLGRCGVHPADAAAFAVAVDALPGLRLEGVFTHAGHAYGEQSREGVERVAADEAAAVRDAAAAIRAQGIAVRTVSAGSTPTAAFLAREPGLTEIRPGNYTFYDAMQVALGTIPAERTALTVVASVISRLGPERAVLDSGSKTLGLDKGAHSGSVVNNFGRLVDGEGVLERLSEEHGMLRIPASSALRPGDRVRILPNHACSVGNLGRFYVGVRDGVIEELITVDAAGGVH